MNFIKIHDGTEFPFYHYAPDISIPRMVLVEIQDPGESPFHHYKILDLKTMSLPFIKGGHDERPISRLEVK